MLSFYLPSQRCIFLPQGTACSLQVFYLDEIQVKVAHLVQHYAFTQLTSEGTIYSPTNTLFSEEFFGLGTWLKMTPPKSFCTFCGLEVGPTCQVQVLDWRRSDFSLNPKQSLKGIYPRVWGIVLIHYKEAEILRAILVSTSAFLCGPSVLVCSFFHLRFCFLEFEFWYLLG